MTEGLLKSAPQPEILKPTPPQHTDTDMPLMLEGVPLDIIRHFGVDVNRMSSKDLGHLRETYVFLDGKNIGEKMENLNHLITKLGSPGIGETLYGRVWSYLKIQNSIKNLEKQKQAMEYGKRT